MRGNDFTNEQRPDSRGTSVIEHVIGAEVLCSEEFSHGENDHGPHHPEGEAAHSNAQDKECFGDGREGEDEMREAAEGAGYEEDDGSGGDDISEMAPVRTRAVAWATLNKARAA
eukprot:CAMPEP_0202453726 /NCGR_PEP_ID=MMETSP1360-20130828/11634_1 /ASSEMBLY_ACC=CAM_ASM_000848 /TAXON_ID=515479 /ORGANISM="Licmophora paradoxa, Strain CCMP2313" /LENGTH=113 /DNA_ID=CAMNT_0049072891 /DNA_START=444 /DNA_END=783 /DNA_ORIENTATION=+